jgi:hypothetical protein
MALFQENNCMALFQEPFVQLTAAKTKDARGKQELQWTKSQSDAKPLLTQFLE